MAKFIIRGGKNLGGTVSVGGAKNQALKLVAFCLLLKDKCTIRNVPDILDIRNQIKIAQSLGLKADLTDNNLVTMPAKITPQNLDFKTAELLRSSIVFWGPLLARFHKLDSPYPGGCAIGARSIDTHLNGFAQAGANIKKEQSRVYLEIKNPKDSKVTLKEQSVSATENILLYSAGINRVTRIANIAIEPEIIDLIKIITKSGARIRWVSDRIIEVAGKESLSIPRIDVIPDRIEAASYAIAFIVTDSVGQIFPFLQEHNKAFLDLIDKSGVNYEMNDRTLYINKSADLQPFKVKTGPFPGFPTDLQSPISLLAAKANGCSQIHEAMFENRFGHLAQLGKMGLRYELLSNHLAKVCGPTTFKPTQIESPDLRSGITLLFAALAAKGETTVSKVEIIDRGYERVEEKLSLIGADIRRID